MALIKCSECGTEISDQATACVKCGAPIDVAKDGKPSVRSSKRANQAPKKRGFGCLTIIGIVFCGFCAIALFGAVFNQRPSGSASSTGTTANQAPSASAPYGEHDGKACAKDDLPCRGEAGVISASVYCKDPIERHAKHSVRWTDGTFEMKMSRYRFTDKSHDTVTYIGDKAEFQNGFGAFTPVIYQCTVGTDNQTVLNVTVAEGRLPE